MRLSVLYHYWARYPADHKITPTRPTVNVLSPDATHGGIDYVPCLPTRRGGRRGTCFSTATGDRRPVDGGTKGHLQLRSTYNWYPSDTRTGAPNIKNTECPSRGLRYGADGGNDRHEAGCQGQAEQTCSSRAGV